MKTDTTKGTTEAAEGTLFLGADWFDPLEAGVRTRIRGFIEELLEAELDAALGRVRAPVTICPMFKYPPSIAQTEVLLSRQRGTAAAIPGREAPSIHRRACLRAPDKTCPRERP